MRILVAESDLAFAGVVERAFLSEGARVDNCDDGDEVLELAKLYDFDAIIVDSELEECSAIQVIKRCRSAEIQTPVIVMSANDDTDLKLRALFAGADDFLTKPFDPRELVARTKTIIRRAHGFAASEIRVGRLSLNLASRTVWVDDQELAVTAKEYSILELLALRKGTTLTKETFLDHLYGGIDEPEQKIIDVFVCKLRKKITAVSNGDQIIETVWGHGYVLKDQAATAPGLAEDQSAFLVEERAEILSRDEELEALLLSLFTA